MWWLSLSLSEDSFNPTKFDLRKTGGRLFCRGVCSQVPRSGDMGDAEPKTISYETE